MTMHIKQRIGIAAAAIIVAGSAGAVAMAAKPDGTTTKPGWGFGDQNHVHTGPPGQSVNLTDVSVTNSSSQSATSGSVNVSGNTTAGSATSGSASNSNTTSTNVEITSEE